MDKAEEKKGQDQAGGSETPKPTFAEYLGKQPDEFRAMVDEHFNSLFEEKAKGLKSALESEREQNKKLQKELKEAAKHMDGDAKVKIEKMTTDLEETSKRASFYEMASQVGVKNLKLAFIIAREEGLLGEDKMDWKKFQSAYPELFGITSGHAGRGAGSEPATKMTIDDVIRRAAGIQ